MAFAINYSFGVVAGIAPDRLAEPSFTLLDLTLSGSSRIFVGKLANYLAHYFSEPAIEMSA
jgi:hypothetical protein